MKPMEAPPSFKRRRCLAGVTCGCCLASTDVRRRRRILPDVETLMAGDKARMAFAGAAVQSGDRAFRGGAAPEHREFLVASGEQTREEFIGFCGDLGQHRGRLRRRRHRVHGMDWRHMGEVLAAGRPLSRSFALNSRRSRSSRPPTKSLACRPNSAKFEAGLVYFPKHAPWLADLEAELFSFPGSRHDDQVDFDLAGAGPGERRHLHGRLPVSSVSPPPADDASGRYRSRGRRFDSALLHQQSQRLSDTLNALARLQRKKLT